MITRLYADNFRCLINFEYKPGALQLLFGGNGTGKTTAMEVLERVREFLALGQSSEAMFPTASLTAWDSRDEQTFELEVSGNGGRYAYRLVIEHNRPQLRNRVKQEELRFDDGLLYQFDGQDAHLYRDDHSAGPSFPFDWSKSCISSIPERRDNQRLTWFRRRLDRVHFLTIDPFRMDDASLKEERLPTINMSNLASWYRHLTQDSPERMAPLFTSLAEVLDGFTGLKLTSAGEMARILRIGFRTRSSTAPSSEFYLRLSDLSPGQRCLIALFLLVHCATNADTTICIDEPDNFVALREIQPWVSQLRDRIEESGGQCLIVSHHPELIDLLAVRHGVLFARNDLGPVRIKVVDWSTADGLSPSEVVARGWED